MMADKTAANTATEGLNRMRDTAKLFSDLSDLFQAASTGRSFRHLCTQYGFDYGKVERFLRSKTLQCCRLNTVMDLADVIPAGQDPYERFYEEVFGAAVFDGILPVDYAETVDAVLNKMTDRKAQVARMYCGLDDGEPQTYEEIGRHFNVTRERIRQTWVNVIHRAGKYPYRDMLREGITQYEAKKKATEELRAIEAQRLEKNARTPS